MDILRKIFGVKSDDPTIGKDATPKDEFRKPQWFEESETDDELFDDSRKFAFEIFTNPLELQKDFEEQMQKILDIVVDFEDSGIKVEKNLKEKFMKPGTENNFMHEFEKQQKKLIDNDIDGQVSMDELRNLMQRIMTTEGEPGAILPRNDNKFSGKNLAKAKLSDEETIMGKIHGTLCDDELHPRFSNRRRELLSPALIPRNLTPFEGVIDGSSQGPKIFRHNVMVKTVRKPDGSFETTKITQDSEGNKTTTVTRMIDGKSETFTTYNRADGEEEVVAPPPPNTGYANMLPVKMHQNIYVTKRGYALPRNIW